MLFVAHPEAALPTLSLANGPTFFPAWPYARPMWWPRMTPRMLCQMLTFPEPLAARSSHGIQLWWRKHKVWRGVSEEAFDFLGKVTERRACWLCPFTWTSLYSPEQLQTSWEIQEATSMKKRLRVAEAKDRRRRSPWWHGWPAWPSPEASPHDLLLNKRYMS